MAIENKKTYCYNCEIETNQEVLFNDESIDFQEMISRNEEGDESQPYKILGLRTWTLSKCLGCDKINFRYFWGEPSKQTNRIFHFPKKQIRKVPSWAIKLPIKYLETLQEVYFAVNEELFLLSLMGIRTLLDIYIIAKIGDIGSFKQKIDKLVSDGIITSAKASVLETTIDAGNAASHRGYKPEKETLFQILDIVENLLHSEIVDRQIKQIKQKIPRRE